jgi:hypothetical protein
MGRATLVSRLVPGVEVSLTTAEGCQRRGRSRIVRRSRKASWQG